MTRVFIISAMPAVGPQPSHPCSSPAGLFDSSRAIRHGAQPAVNFCSTSASDTGSSSLRTGQKSRQVSPAQERHPGALSSGRINGSRIHDRRIAARGVSAVGKTEEGMSAGRQRRLERGRLERERRNAEKAKLYPDWAKVLESGAKDDQELREILGNSVGDPEEMRKRIEDRFHRKGGEVLQPKSGSAIPMKVVFYEFDPFDVNIWIELYNTPSEDDVEIVGTVMKSWFVMGQLGAFNASKMQLSRLDPESSYKYDPDKDALAMPALFHNIGDLEFQDNLGRIWLDLGTSDAVALDMLVNALSSVSSDHVGIKCLTFGGKRIGDWEDGMTREEDGYICYSI